MASPVQMLTLQQAADRLGVHYMTAYRYIRTGRLPATKHGAEWRVRAADVEKMAAPSARKPPRRLRGSADYTARLADRLVKGDEAGAWTVVESALTAGLDPAEVYLDLLIPAMQLIGDRWEAGDVDVAEEHQASALMLRIIGRLGPRLRRRGRTRGSVVLGAPPTDAHSLPIAFASDLLRQRGFRVYDLGGDVPAQSLAETASNAERLLGVGIGATASGTDRQIRTAVRAVKDRVDAPVVLGGRAIGDLEHARRLGGDAFAALGAGPGRGLRRPGQDRRDTGVGRDMSDPLLKRAADSALEATVVLSFSRIGHLARRRIWRWRPPHRLDGRQVMITGPTSGLGFAAATAFAGLGARVHLVGRDADRTSAAASRIAELSGNDDLRVWVADISNLEQVRDLGSRAGAEIAELHCLVHNAGALLPRRELTSEGFETTVATQVLGPFLLTGLLLPALSRTSGSRVVTVSSGGMYSERLVVDRLQMHPHEYEGTKAYARAKRAQVELTREWARRVPSPPSFHAMHPGWAATPGVAAALPRFDRIMAPLLRTPEEGADTIVWLASSPDLGSNGDFWLDRRRRSTVYLPWTRAAEGEAERLWDWVVDRTGALPQAGD